MFNPFEMVRVDWSFSVRQELPVVDVIGIVKGPNTDGLLISGLKLIDIAQECKGVLYSNGIKHPIPPKGSSICYFAIFFENDKDIAKFQKKTKEAF